MTDLLIDTADGVMTITLNRVDKKNSFSRAMYGACAEAQRDAGQEARPRALPKCPRHGAAVHFAAWMSVTTNPVSDFWTTKRTLSPALRNRTTWPFLVS